MSDSEVIVGGPQLPQPNTYNPILASNTVPGMVLAASAAADDTAVLANNTAAGTRQIIGMAVQGGDAGARAACRYAGPVVLSHAEWDAIAGTSGGLARNTWYYVSAATAGHITSAASANAAIGFAISSTCLIVAIKQVPPTS